MGLDQSCAEPAQLPRARLPRRLLVHQPAPQGREAALAAAGEQEGRQALEVEHGRRHGVGEAAAEAGEEAVAVTSQDQRPGGEELEQFRQLLSLRRQPGFGFLVQTEVSHAPGEGPAFGRVVVGPQPSGRDELDLALPVGEGARGEVEDAVPDGVGTGRPAGDEDGVEGGVHGLVKREETPSRLLFVGFWSRRDNT